MPSALRHGKEDCSEIEHRHKSLLDSGNSSGSYKAWIPDCGLDCALDSGLNSRQFGLEFEHQGLKVRK